jgi:Bacterial SH3 domain
MPVVPSLPFAPAGGLLAGVLATSGLAQPIRTVRVDPAAAAGGTVIAGEIRGDESADYVVAAEAGQTISVDLLSPNASADFNVLPAGAQEAIFIGSTSGAVADLSVPETGDYVVQVYLMRNAARRDEMASYTLGIGIGGPDFADGLAGGPDWWQVAGLSAGGALNVRSGPATRYPVVGKAQNGETLQNRGCRMTGPERWCSVRASGSGQQGWVAGRFLVEAAPPTQPAAMEGGPVGEDATFDATGLVPCATTLGQPTRDCPFGVVRDGPGAAGVWIALGDGEERQVLFEGNAPVATNIDAALTYEKQADLFLVRIGDERYEIPEAVVNGG